MGELSASTVAPCQFMTSRRKSLYDIIVVGGAVPLSFMDELRGQKVALMSGTRAALDLDISLHGHFVFKTVHVTKYRGYS